MRPQKKKSNSGVDVRTEFSRSSSKWGVQRKPQKGIKQAFQDCVACWQIASTNLHHLGCSPEILLLCGFKLEIVNERSFQGIWKVHIKLRSLIIRSHESGKASTLTWQFSRPPQRLPAPQSQQCSRTSLWSIARLTGFSNFLKSSHDSTQADALKHLVTFLHFSAPPTFSCLLVPDLKPLHLQYVSGSGSVFLTRPDCCKPSLEMHFELTL